MCGRRAELEVREEEPGRMGRKRFILRAPETPPLLNIFEATYGPHGTGSYDGGAASVMDVTEKICGL